jgi:hypothetical protein
MADLCEESQGIRASYWDNPNYLENQWAEDTLVAFEREHGEEGEYFLNLASMLSHLARWCDANGLRLSDALQIAAAEYDAETEGKGQQFSTLT